MKDTLNKFKGLDRKLITYIIVGFVAVIGMIIVLVILKTAVFSKITPEELENKMVIAAENYFYDKKESLPINDKDVATVTISELINNGNLKSLDKLLKDKTLSCSGEVTVTKNENYYLYSPNLNCGESYKTKKLYEVITSVENIVTEKDGLYKIENDYVYRGEKVNNYVEFANQLWRILRVNGSDNSIRLVQVDTTEDKQFVWDDRYNADNQSNSGINNYEVSRLKDTINKYWTDNLFIKEKYKKYVSTQRICIGARMKNDTDKTDKIECSKLANSNQSLTLMRPSEYLIVSLDSGCLNSNSKQCTNYNYLQNLNGSSWTITPYKKSTYEAFVFGSGLSVSETSDEIELRFVLNLSSEVLYSSGDGTKDNPYKIKIVNA